MCKVVTGHKVISVSNMNRQIELADACWNSVRQAEYVRACQGSLHHHNVRRRHNVHRSLLHRCNWMDDTMIYEEDKVSICTSYIG